VFGFISLKLGTPFLVPVTAVKFINPKINIDISQLCFAMMTSES
jgi:hypothetical protein